MAEVASSALVEQIAARALGYVLDPPTGDAAVIHHASPDELIDVFDTSVGFSLEPGGPHDDVAVLRAVDDVIRWSVHTSHPRFMNQNFAGPDPVAVVGDWLGAALNTTGATYEAAPVFTLMERAVLRRLAALAGYPLRGGISGGAAPPGLFCAGGSMGTLMALQLARHRHTPSVVSEGASGERFAVYVSSSGHYSAVKSAALLGLGGRAVVEVETDAGGAMIPAALAAAIERTADGGATPLAVIATSGSTVTAAFDPLDPIADICGELGLWLHVDGCYGGSALFSQHQRHRLAGVERSDSMVWNLHKMMGMTQQCTALLVREPERLESCFATGADYLFQPDKPHGDLDAGDRTFMCARRVDVLKAWLAWKVHGDDGFAARVDRAVALADHARALIAASGGALVPVVAGDFTNVCFVWVPPDLRPLDVGGLTPHDRSRLDSLAPAIKRRMLAEGTAMLGHQPVNGVNAFRLIVMNPEVTEADIDRTLELVCEYGEASDL